MKGGDKIMDLGNDKNEREGIKALIDYISFTLPFNSVNETCNLLGISESDLVLLDYGKYGYKSQYRFGNIMILANGHNADMGIHISMSGEGCRQYETILKRDGDIWIELMKKVSDNQGHFTRLDVALDSYSKHFTIDDIIKKVRNGEVKSYMRDRRIIESYKVDISKGATVYFGSPTSDIGIRIYDKAKEQEVNYDWIRVELQCRDERADVLLKVIYRNNHFNLESLGATVSGVIKNYLNFIDPSNDKNKSRWSVSSFWTLFLGNVEKTKLTVENDKKTIEDKLEWLKKSVSPTMAIVDRYYKRYEKNSNYFFQDLITYGNKRLKPRHLVFLQGSG